jgi:hypothetical protein
MREAIEPFVRKTLGCKCPDEVFASIEVTPLQVAGFPSPVTRLLVGNRLLIYIIDPLPTERLAELVATLTARGRAERDSGGYNRFRLVIGAEDHARVTRAIEAGFKSAAAGDERLHLHVVATSALPILDP